MAKHKGVLSFHGAFKNKRAALRKERSEPGTFILKRKMGSNHKRERYLVVKTKR